jgi:hypothetical protein
VSLALVDQLANYADVPLTPDGAAKLTDVLASALTKLRAIKPDHYDHLAPATGFHVPVRLPAFAKASAFAEATADRSAGKKPDTTYEVDPSQ